MEYAPERDPSKVGDLVNVREHEKTMARKCIEESKQRPDEMTELVRRTDAAREALMSALGGIGDAIELFKPQSDQYIKELRAFATSGVLELKTMMRTFEDVRKFFLSDQHATEVKRLAEFVELCERLSKLKQSGFLDAVSDTILKLEADQSKKKADLESLTPAQPEYPEISESELMEMLLGGAISAREYTSISRSLHSGS